MTLELDSAGVSAIVDHPFVPREQWWTTCGHEKHFGAMPSDLCGLAEAAHAETTLKREKATQRMARKSRALTRHEETDA